MKRKFTNGAPLVAQIYEQLHKAIVTMELMPGQNLSEKDLSSEMGVSRQPVREALIKLKEAGLVTVLPQRGTYVVPISKKSILNAQFIREALETALVLDVVGNTNPEFEQRMHDLLDKQTAAGACGNWTEFVKWDDLFHKAFADFAGRQRTWRVIEAEKAHLDRMRHLNVREQVSIQRMIEQHKAILKSVLAGNQEEAKKSVRRHMQEILRFLPLISKEHADLFEDDEASPPQRRNEMAISDIFQAVLSFNEAQVTDLVKAEVNSGAEMGEILNQGLIAAMDEVGNRFSAGELFVPEMLMAAQAMKGGLEVLKPLMSGEDAQSRGTVVIGTVKGDLHDIGKNLVSMMLEGAGFNVVDLGVDVDVDKFVQAAKENQADLVALSALLTTTMPAMETCVSTFKEQGITVKSIVGGAPVTQEFADKIGADGYAQDAPGAVALARDLVGA